MTQNNNTELSFLDRKDSGRFTFKDVLMTILCNLHWLVRCACIGAAVAWWKSDCTERCYESHARIKIHSVTRNAADDGLERENVSMKRASGNWNTLNDEILILKSETAMLEVARRLNLGVTYQYTTKVAKRIKDLYGDVPIDVSFLDLDDTDYASLTVTILGDSIELGIGGTVIDGLMGEVLSTPLGRLSVNPTWAMRDSYIGYCIRVTHRDIVDVAATYRNRVNVTKNSSSDWIVDLSLKDGSPRRAADIINEMISVYNETSINNIRQTTEYINERIARLETELGSQEAQIAEFKRQNQLLDEDYGQMYVAASIASTEELERLKGQIEHARYIKSLAEDDSENRLLPMTVTIDDDIIHNTIAKFNETVLQLDKYNVSGTTNNPVVQDMLLNLQAMRVNLGRLLDSYIVALKQKCVQVESAVQWANGMIKDVPGGQLYLENLARVEGIKEKLFVDLLGKREEMLVSQPSIEGNAKVVDRARVNREPVSPDIKKNTLSGAFIGLLVPIVIFLLWSLLDTRVRGRKDVEDNCDVPVLGVIPSASKWYNGCLVVMDDDNNDAISEAFRILRSNLDTSRKTGANGVSCLFTSLQEGAGKTFVAANVALGLARIGRHVVLLDMNLRKGTLSDSVELSDGDSLSGYLAGESSSLPSLIQTSEDLPSVDIIPCGDLPGNPADLLSSKRLDLLMAWLRERYDYILLDAVPYGIVADGSILRRITDLSIFVLRYGQVDKRMLPELQKIKDNNEFPEVSVVLNDVRYKSRLRYYGFGREEGYGTVYEYDRQYGYKQ